MDDREDDDQEAHHHQEKTNDTMSLPASCPFAQFSNLHAQWKADLQNTTFYIARLPASPPSTLSHRELCKRHQQQSAICDLLVKIRRAFFTIATDAHQTIGQEPYVSDFQGDVNEVVRGLRYVQVRWGSFLKRNTATSLQNGTWIKEVGLLAHQMWTELRRAQKWLEVVELEIENRETALEYFKENEEIWNEDYEYLLEQGKLKL